MTVMRADTLQEKSESSRAKSFAKGMRDCTVTAAGYFVVSFALGISMHRAGLNGLQSFVCALLNNASAGEYAGIAMIASSASLLQTALITLTTNIRYLLMSCSLSQKLSEDISVAQRMLIGFDVTDELFGLAISQEGMLSPWYYYGMMALALPAWAFGTLIGALAGEVMSASLISAFSASLYVMFLAIIIPAGKKDHTVGRLVVIGFTLSYFLSVVPLVSLIPEGVRTIVLTIALAAGAAVLAPVKEEK